MCHRTRQNGDFIVLTQFSELNDQEASASWSDCPMHHHCNSTQTTAFQFHNFKFFTFLPSILCFSICILYFSSSSWFYSVKTTISSRVKSYYTLSLSCWAATICNDDKNSLAITTTTTTNHYNENIKMSTKTTTTTELIIMNDKYLNSGMV